MQGRLCWSCAKPVALQFAQLLMSEPVDPAVEFTSTHTDGFLELIRQVAGEAAVAWKAETGLPVELNFQAAVPEEIAAKHTVVISLQSETWKDLNLRLDLDAEFLAALNASPAAQEKNVTPAAEENEAEGHALSSNLDLILDVQLEATIRFGEREMLLRDVFGLLPGAVVELDQLVNEPAELLVAGRLVARGEVVVVDGNFGLRVSEVVRAGQRAAVLSL